MVGTNEGGVGPCGACKYLRRRCVKGCVFAPYFDSGAGTSHFAAVHRVFGASNAAKLLLGIPPHSRLHAVVTLCFEALARVTDPVYGCSGKIFTLQQQVLNLQAELALVQARISTLQHCHGSLTSNNVNNVQSSPVLEKISNCTTQTISFSASGSEEVKTEIPSVCHAVDKELMEDSDLHLLAREYVSKYSPGVRVFNPPPPM